MFVLTLTLLSADVYAEKNSGIIPQKVQERADNLIILSVIDADNEVIHSENSIILSKNGIVPASCFAVSKWFDSSGNRMIFTLSSGKKIPADFMLSDRCERGVAYIKIEAPELPDPAIPIAASRPASDAVYIGSLENGKPLFSRIKTSGASAGFFKIISAKSDISGPVFNSMGELVGLHTIINYVKGPYYSGIPSLPIKTSFTKYAALMHKVDAALSAASKAKEIRKKEAAAKPETSQTVKADIPVADEPTPPKPAIILPEHEQLFKEAAASQQASRHAEAVDLYKKAILIKHDFMQAHIRLGILLFNMGSYAESAETFRSAIRIDPKSSFLNNRLGTALLAVGRYAAANEIFRNAVRLNPADTEAHFNLGVAQFLAGNRQDAWVQYIILKELDQEMAKRLLNLIN